MKRGLWRTIIAATILLVFMLAGAACASEAIEAPTPEVDEPTSAILTGEDLTFRFWTYEETDPDKPVSYEVWVNGGTEPCVTPEKEGKVTIPWAALSECGSEATITVRACGEGYIPQETSWTVHIVTPVTGGPAVTFTSQSEDGHFWLEDGATVWIDATGATELYYKVPNGDSFEALHDDWYWNEALEEEYGWGLRHEHVNFSCHLYTDGDYTVKVLAYMPAPTDDDPDAMAWKMSTATLQVEPRGQIADPGVTVSGLDENGCIGRGEVLDVSVTMSTGRNFHLGIYAADEDGEIIETEDEENLFGYRYGYESCECAFSTMEMPAGNYVLNVSERRDGYLSGETNIPFTVVTGEGFTLPEEPVWTLSKNSVDTEEPFDVSVYIPADDTQFGTPWTSLWIDQNDEYAVGNDSQGNFCALRNVTLHSDAPVTIRVHREYPNGGDVDIVYEGQFTVKPATDAPTPKVTGLDTTHLIGEDLTFTIGIEESEADKLIAGKPLKYEVWLEGHNYIFDHAGSITIPWEGFVTEYNIPYPGEKVNLYIRAFGQGYNEKEIRKEVVLYEAADENFRIAFAGTDEEHIRLVVRQKYTLLVQLPDDTTGIESVQIYTENTGWGYDSYTPASLPAGGIRTGYMGEVRDNSPVMARYTKTDGTIHYSNVLLADYYNLGPLPDLQVTTNLTMTDGAYHVSRGDFILAAVDNPAAFAGKGEQTVFRVRIEDRSKGYDQEVESNEKAFDGIYTEVCVPTGELEVREEPYYLVATISTRDNVWEDSTVEFPLYVDGDAEMFEGVLITATKTEAETHETIHIQVSAPEAQSVEIFNGSKDDGYSIEEYMEEYACITRSFGSAGSECFWARAYYRDGTTADSDVLEIHVSAPYGDLEDVLTVSAPVQVQAHQPFTVRTVSRNTDDPVIPDRLRVSLSPYGGGWNDDEYTAVQTGEVTVPATNGDGDWVIEAGQLYSMLVEVSKQGYNAASFSRTIYAPDAEQTNNAVLTVNGKTTGVTLENGTNYTVSVTGLPEGVTCVAILDVNGSGWNLAYPEEGATSATRDDISLHTRQEQAEIYALYTTDPNAGSYYGSDNAWIGCTNVVPVTITCNHTSTVTKVFWDEQSYIADGKKNHLITGRGEKWICCEYCDAKLELLEEVTSVSQPHSFYEGECELCGFVCQHEGEDVAHASYMEGGSVITAEDQYTHHITGTRVEYDWCTNCGINLGETRTQVDAYEKHEYDAAYHCDVCGYEAPDNYLNVSYTDGCQEYMNVQPGTDVTLGVTAESSLSSTFTYQWCERDPAGNWYDTYTPIEGETGPTITLANLQGPRFLYVQVTDGYVHEEQYFEITIDNEFTASSATDSPVTVAVNGTAELRVSAYCRDGALTYEWSRGIYNDDLDELTYEPIPNSDRAVLTTQPMTRREHYRCLVRDIYGNQGQTDFEVWVNSHLTLTVSGESTINTAPGSDVTLTVTGRSDLTDRIRYTWEEAIQTNPYSYMHQSLDTTGPSCTLRNLTKSRTVTVKASDGYMETSTTFTIHVDSQLDAYIDGDNRVTADYGTPVTFSVKATDMFDGAGITYRWYIMRDNPYGYDQYAEELGDEADLEITALYSGVIYCDVKNEYGMMTLGVRLDVDTHLTADAESHEYKVPYGDPMLLTVNAAGLKNTFSYTWYSEKEDGSDWQEIPGETGSTLQIDAVTEPLVYSCRVDDGVNTYGVNQILVEPDTQLTVEPVSPTAFAVTGEPVTMSVSVNSLREPETITCSWYRFDWATGESEEIEGADGTSLTVTPTGPARYRCQVTDGLDIKHADFLTCTESVTDHYNQYSEYWVNYGTVVNLRISAASPDGPAAYQWRHGDTVLAGETGPTLTVTATENTYYSCDVRFGNSTEIYDTKRFHIRIRNEVTIDRTNDRSLWVIPQEGLTLTVNATSRDGSDLRYKWYKNGYVIPDETGSSLTVAYETMCGLIHYSCNVSDVYGNDEQDAYFNCFSGEPETMQAGTTVTCTGDERFLRFTPAASAVYTMTLTGTVYDAIIYPANGEQSFLLWPDEPREIRLQGGLDYYIRLTEGHTLTVALKQEEQETYAFSLQRNDRIRVPDLTLNGRDYPLTNLVSGDPSVVYVNGDAIRALKTGQATVMATYQGGVATRVFTITVANGPVLKLPYDLNEIRADAFAGDTGLRFIELGYSVQNVRRGAFANTGSVTVYVNGYNTAFEDGAFTGSSPVILCENGSPAAMYCSEKGLLYFRME